MKVPEYDSPQVAPQAAPDVHVQAAIDPAGQAIGQGLEQLGAGVERGADDIITAQRMAAKKANAIWAANAHTQYAHDSTTALDGNQGGTADVNGGATPSETQVAGDSAFGDAPVGHTTPTGPSRAAVDASSDASSGISPKGLLNEQGQAAAQYAHPTMEWLSSRRDTIAQGAPNDDARRMFLESSGKLLEDHRATVERHTAQQIQIAGEQALLARSAIGLNSIVNDITATTTDPTGLAHPPKDSDILYSLDANTEEVARTIQAIHPGELGAQQAQAFKEKATALVMTHYLDAKDYRGAQNLFDARRADLGTQAEHFQKTIQAGQDLQTGDALAGKILGGATRDSGMVDVAKAITDYNVLPQQQRTKAADEAIHKRIALAGEANTSMVAGNFNDAFGQYLQNHSLSDVNPSTKAWLQANAGAKWHELEQIDYQHQREMAPRGGKKSDEITPQQVSLGRLLADMGSNGDQYAAMPYDQFVSGFAGKLDSKGFKTASDKFAEIKKAAAAPDRDTTLPTNAQRVVLEMGHGTLWNKEEPTKMNDDAAAAYQKVTDSAEQFRKTFKASHRGNEPTTEDYKAALAPEFRSVPVPGMIYGTNDIPAVKFETSSKYKGKTLAVPDDFAAQAQAKAKARGRALTPELLSAAYLEYAKAGGNEAKPSGATDAASPAPKADPFEFDNPAVRRVLDPFGYHEGPQVTVPTLSASVGATPPTLTGSVAATPAPAAKAKKPKAKKATAPDESLQSVMEGIVKNADTNQGGT